MRSGRGGGTPIRGSQNGDIVGGICVVWIYWTYVGWIRGSTMKLRLEVMLFGLYAMVNEQTIASRFSRAGYERKNAAFINHTYL